MTGSLDLEFGLAVYSCPKFSINRRARPDRPLTVAKISLQGRGTLHELFVIHTKHFRGSNHLPQQGKGFPKAENHLLI